jgi:hypothetical protein
MWVNFLAASVLVLIIPCDGADVREQSFIGQHCYDCHDGDEKKGGLDPTALKPNFSAAEAFAIWVRVDDRIASGEMPPKRKARPAAGDAAAVTKWLYHVEPDAKLDDHALACRLSYFLWNSMPDARLTELAAYGKFRATLHDEVERMLKDAKFQRFIEDFPGQWLKLRAIAANDPDKKLYPEFKTLLAADTPQLLKNLAQQFAIYSTGRDLAFSDRDEIAGIVARTETQGGGIRTLLHELVQSRLFQAP